MTADIDPEVVSRRMRQAFEAFMVRQGRELRISVQGEAVPQWLRSHAPNLGMRQYGQLGMVTCRWGGEEGGSVEFIYLAAHEEPEGPEAICAAARALSEVPEAGLLLTKSQVTVHLDDRRVDV